MFSKMSPIRRPEPAVRKDVSTVLASNPAPAPKPAEATTNSGGSAAPKEVEKAKEPMPAEIGAGARLVVGPDVKLKGAEILDCDTLVVEGRVEATMDSRIIRISEQGNFTGKVSIDIAEIHGHFEGELTARIQLIIHATGRVSGKVRYGKLVIDEGGELCGDINALSAESHSVTSFGKPQIALSQSAG